MFFILLTYISELFHSCSSPVLGVFWGLWPLIFHLPTSLNKIRLKKSIFLKYLPFTPFTFQLTPPSACGDTHSVRRPVIVRRPVSQKAR